MVAGYTTGLHVLRIICTSTKMYLTFYGAWDRLLLQIYAIAIVSSLYSDVVPSPFVGIQIHTAEKC
jgi:TctA family transporter